MTKETVEILGTIANVLGKTGNNHLITEIAKEDYKVAQVLDMFKNETWFT